MKGLLIKDFKLMKNMRNSMAIIILIALFVCINQDASFIIVYLSVIGSTFTTSTLSYDEFDNGYAYLFSLPVTRRGYVAEKYLFGLCMSGGGWLTGVLISLSVGMARKTAAPKDLILTGLMLLPVVLILLAVLLPFYLKFSREKARIVVMAAMGLIFALCIFGAKLAKTMQIDLNALLDNLPRMGAGTAAVSVAAVGVLMLLISLRISMGIMERREF